MRIRSFHRIRKNLRFIVISFSYILNRNHVVLKLSCVLPVVCCLFGSFLLFIFVLLVKMVLLLNHPPPTEGLHHIEQNVTAFCTDKNLGKGTLYISESVVSWVNPTGEGFSLPYFSISIHAVCKDLSHFPHECILMNVAGNLSLEEEEEEQSEISGALSNLSVGDEDAEDDDFKEDFEPSYDVRFVPDNKEMLQAIYQCIADCQVLNPEPPQEDDQEEDDMDGDIVFPSSFNIQYVANGTLEELEAEAEENEEDEEMTEEQFEDADDM